MLLGRFLMIIPMLAIAGNPRRQKKLVTRTAGTFPVNTPLFTVPAHLGVHRHRRRAYLLPRLALGPILEHLLLARRARASKERETACRKQQTSRSLCRPATDLIVARAAIDAAFRKLDPGTMMKNPVMFVVEVGSVLTTIYL